MGCHQASRQSVPSFFGQDSIQKIDEKSLLPQAFVQEAAFLFPLESKALTRVLMRREFVRLENQRLLYSANQEALALSLSKGEEEIQSNLLAGQSLDYWAQHRYGHPWREVRQAMATRFEENQIYQLCARAWTLQQDQVRLRLGVSENEEQAHAWVRRLRSGANPQFLAAESLDPGPQGDARLPWLPIALPTPLGEMLKGCQPGQTLDPFVFPGERLWRVAWVEKWKAGVAALPSASLLFENLTQNPLSSLEAEAWFQAMLRRYTAVQGRTGIQALRPAFIPQSYD